MRRAGKDAAPRIGKDDCAKVMARTPFGLPDETVYEKLNQLEEEEEEQKDASPGSVGLKRKLSFDEVRQSYCVFRLRCRSFCSPTYWTDNSEHGSEYDIPQQDLMPDVLSRRVSVWISFPHKTFDASRMRLA